MDRLMLGVHPPVARVLFRVKMRLPFIQAFEVMESAESHVGGMGAQPHGAPDLAEQFVVGIIPCGLNAQGTEYFDRRMAIALYELNIQHEPPIGRAAAYQAYFGTTKKAKFSGRSV
jgi:hypothetical protein